MDFIVYLGASIIALIGVVLFGYGIFNDEKWYQKIEEIFFGAILFVTAGRVFGFW